MKVQAKIKMEIEVTHIKVSAQVRYWSDSSVDGRPDMDGDQIPFRNGDLWTPVIEIDTGRVLDWPAGTTADVHYKVCDAGLYELIDANGKTVASKEGYVPDFLAPGGGGYGDYIILNIDAEGQIEKWRAPEFGDYADDEDESEWTWTPAEATP